MHLKTVLLPAALTLVVASVAHGQMFQQQTTTRFPVQSEYSNQLTVVDIDGDGDLDIVWANGQGYSSAGVALKPRVYVNNGAGVFTDETDIRVPGVTGWFRGVEAGDADGDGDPDLILAQDFNKQPKLLINNGSGVFADETASRLPVQTLSSSRAQFADVDNDGDLDIALCNSGTSSRFGSGQPKLWLNNGSGVFTDATATNFPVGNISEQMDVIFGDVDGDLDIDTLDLLEDLLQAYAGTVFLVSHDRRFLDDVVTSTIAWEGDPAFGGRPGLWREYEGGYEDWKLQRERARVAAEAPPLPKPAPAAAPAPAPKARTKLSYKEQRELDELPARIEALEAEQKTLAGRLAGSELYLNEPQRVPELQARHEAIEAELMAALERWEHLASR